MCVSRERAPPTAFSAAGTMPPRVLGRGVRANPHVQLSLSSRSPSNAATVLVERTGCNTLTATAGTRLNPTGSSGANGLGAVERGAEAPAPESLPGVECVSVAGQMGLGRGWSQRGLEEAGARLADADRHVAGAHASPRLISHCAIGSDGCASGLPLLATRRLLRLLGLEAHHGRPVGLLDQLRLFDWRVLRFVRHRRSLLGSWMGGSVTAKERRGGVVGRSTRRGAADTATASASRSWRAARPTGRIVTSAPISTSRSNGSPSGRSGRMK